MKTIQFKTINIKIIFLVILFILLSTQTIAFAFEDVSEEDWYYNDIQSLKEKGLINGYEGNIFKPNSEISNAEVITIIIRALAPNEKIEKEKNAKWYYGSMQKAKEIGLIEETIADDKAERPSTRKESIEYISNLIDNIEKVNFEEKYFSDINSQKINLLKKLGIVNGIDTQNGTLIFNPENSITRAEISALINRTIKNKPTIDVTIKKMIVEENMSEETTKEVITETEKFFECYTEEEINFKEEPLSVTDFGKVFLNISKRNKTEIILDYKGKTFQEIKNGKYLENITVAFRKVFAKYPEQFSFYTSIQYHLTEKNGNTQITISLINKNFGESIAQKIKSDFEKAVDLKLEEFYNIGYLNDDMSQTEKAKKVYEWVVLNTIYDEEVDNKYTYNGYGQIIEGEAVCQGYVATYNRMLKKIGIKATGIKGYANNQPHIWTLAKLDGDFKYIDPTWGDSYLDTNKVNYMFFGIEEETLRTTHTWDITQSSEFKETEFAKNDTNEE